MTETQLNLGIELSEKIKRLEDSRSNYKKAFDEVCSTEEENIEINFDDTRSVFLDFPKLEVQKFFEYRIKQIDFELEDLKTKFKQL